MTSLNLSCHAEKACAFATVDVMDMDQMDISCTGGDPDDRTMYSCKKMNVTAANVSTVNIDCAYGCGGGEDDKSFYKFADVDEITTKCEYQSCRYFDWSFQNVTSVEMICAEKGCYDSALMIADASTVFFDCTAVGVHCWGDNDGDTSFYLENAGNMFVHGDT